MNTQRRPRAAKAEQIETRALELAAANDAVVQLHLVECRDRYLALNGDIKEIKTLMFRGLAALVVLLLSVLGYLVARGGVPTIH